MKLNMHIHAASHSCQLKAASSKAPSLKGQPQRQPLVDQHQTRPVSQQQDPQCRMHLLKQLSNSHLTRHGLCLRQVHSHMGSHRQATPLLLVATCSRLATYQQENPRLQHHVQYLSCPGLVECILRMQKVPACGAGSSIRHDWLGPAACRAPKAKEAAQQEGQKGCSCCSCSQTSSPLVNPGRAGEYKQDRKGASISESSCSRSAQFDQLSKSMPQA